MTVRLLYWCGFTSNWGEFKEKLMVDKKSSVTEVAQGEDEQTLQDW